MIQMISAVLGLYFLAALCYCVQYVSRKTFWVKAGYAACAAGFFLHSIMLAGRWFQTGHPPFATLYESLIFFAWAVVFMGLILGRSSLAQQLGAFIVVFAVILLGYASTLDKAVRPLLPALRSNWLFIHVSCYLIGYGAATVAFVAGVRYLWLIRRPSPDPGLAQRFDELSHRLITLAFPFLTVGLTSGAVWANVAWGRYWGWDPKETWSLVTWLIYLIYLHLRATNINSRRLAAVLSVLGFLAIIFTFLGVSFLLRGMHSYK